MYVSIRFQLVSSIRFGGNTSCHEVSPHILFSASAVASGLTRLSFFALLGSVSWKKHQPCKNTHPLGSVFGMTGSLAVLAFRKLSLQRGVMDPKYFSIIPSIGICVKVHNRNNDVNLQLSCLVSGTRKEFFPL